MLLEIRKTVTGRLSQWKPNQYRVATIKVTQLTPIFNTDLGVFEPGESKYAFRNSKNGYWEALAVETEPVPSGNLKTY